MGKNILVEYTPDRVRRKIIGILEDKLENTDSTSERVMYKLLIDEISKGLGGEESG